VQQALIPGRRRRGLAALLAFAALGAGAVEPPPEPKRPPFLTPGAPFTLPPVEIPGRPPAPGVGRIALRAVSFTGNTVASTEELQAVAAPYLNKPANGAVLEELREALTRHYVQRGYINSGAVLESVNAAAGVAAYRIIEGRLVAVRLRGLDGLHERYVASRLVRDGDGAFNVNVLRERFEILLADPLFARMNARIVPGPSPGEAILDIDIERGPASQLTVYANNYRPPSIGANGIGLRGTLRNLTGWGDTIEASIEDSWHWDSGLRVHVNARVPVNAHGTGVFARYERDRSSVLEEPIRIVDINSRLETAEAGVTQTLWEDLRSRFSLAVSFMGRENRTWLLGEPFSFTPGEPEGITRARSWRFWQEYSRRSERDAFVARSIFSWVRNNLEPAPDIASAQRPDRYYQFWLGQAQYARRITESGIQAIVRATVQRTHDQLLPLDALPIGGIASVRGYRENQLIRDIAQVVNLDVEFPVWRDGDRSATLIPFADYGHGRGRSQPATTLSSVGVAAKLNWGRLMASLAIGHKFNHPPAVQASHGTLQDHGVHFELAWRLD
jgi:hemolysin activation/secretion protein